MQWSLSTWGIDICCTKERRHCDRDSEEGWLDTDFYTSSLFNSGTRLTQYSLSRAFGTAVLDSRKVTLSVCWLLFISIVYNVISSLSILSLMCDIIPCQCRYHADNYTNRSFHLMSWGMNPSLTSKFVKHESSRSHADRCSTEVFYSSFFETAECWVSSSFVLPVKKTMNFMSLRRPSGQDRLQMLPHMLVIVGRFCSNRWVNVGEFYRYYDVTLTSRRLLGCWQQCTSTVYPATLFGETLHWATSRKGVRFERQLISLQVN